MGKAIYDFSSFFKNLTGRVHLDYIDSRWLFNDSHMQGYENRPYVMLKRIFDIIFSFLLVLMAIPLFILISVIIKLTSIGPIFFAQKRIGVKETDFLCYKFRTMHIDAEKETGPIWANETDKRITSFGRFLRRTRLDELPQLINVIKGEMSFIGPRPIRREFADKLSESILFYSLRFNVKPGLSGWAQVNMGYCGTIEEQKEKFTYDLFYIQNISLFLDILIIIKTVRKLLWVQGI